MSIQKLWRGELSLPVTYWVFGVLGGGMVSVLSIALLTAAASDDFRAAEQVGGTLAVLTLFVGYMTWVNVGIWRRAVSGSA